MDRVTHNFGPMRTLKHTAFVPSISERREPGLTPVSSSLNWCSASANCCSSREELCDEVAACICSSC